MSPTPSHTSHPLLSAIQPLIGAMGCTIVSSADREASDVPVIVGVGVSNAAQAVEACRVADGVVQGAAVVRRLMELGPDAVGNYVAEVRAALDGRS